MTQKLIRSSLLAASLLSLMLTTACGDEASDMQRSANKAQSEANVKIEDANAKADQEIRTAQAEADKTIAGERADFKTLREDYRHAMTIKLVEFDKKVADLDAKAKTANGNEKADLDAKLLAIRTHRDAFARDYETLENESAATWDATKERLDREWAELSAHL
ncbi:MAG: hypothetical protein Q8P18_26470 [Pseudomonadota bacterium]|nr:hypothetical protein [Pseudomonadota bacterium]